MLNLSAEKVEKLKKKPSTSKKDEESGTGIKNQGSSLREHITDVHARLEAAYSVVKQLNRQLYALSDNSSLAGAGLKNVGNMVVTHGAKEGAKILGTAVGAGLGTLAAPGVGTALGAVVGLAFSQAVDYVMGKLMDKAKLSDPIYPRTSKLDTKTINNASRNVLVNKISEYLPNQKGGMKKNTETLGGIGVDKAIDAIAGFDVPTIGVFAIGNFIIDLSKSTNGLTDEKYKKIIDKSTELEQYIELQFASAAEAFKELSKDKIHLSGVKASLKKVYGGGEITLNEMQTMKEKAINCSVQNKKIAVDTLDLINDRKEHKSFEVKEAARKDRLMRMRESRQNKRGQRGKQGINT